MDEQLRYKNLLDELVSRLYLVIEKRRLSANSQIVRDELREVEKALFLLKSEMQREFSAEKCFMINK